MAKADVILNLVKNGLRGDQRRFRKAAESLLEDEATKAHPILIQQLENLLNGANDSDQTQTGLPPGLRGAISVVEPSKSLEQIILPDNALELVDEIVHEHRHRELLEEHGLSPRHKFLFYGPPGNGKTSLAEGIAHTLDVPLYVLRYEDLITSYLGKTAKNMSVVFDFVKNGDCVLLLDEFEAISKERGDDQDLGEIKRIVSSLLTQLDRLPSHVILVSATNHSSMVDTAFWRRFEVHLMLEK
ncbi:MAG: ATP-binding protein, partial [Pseudomonadota bacterium]